MANLEDSITAAKDKLPNITPTPPEFHQQANAHEVKARLQWGEPGLTIVDVRDHDAFNECRIKGAITLPKDNMMEMATVALLPGRDIYVYGATDEETAEAAQQLRAGGFSKVAELKGGINAWKEIAGDLEGPGADQPPGPGAYNVGARLQEFAQVKEKERKMQ